ncbi:MAG: M28 family peptidase [Coriobacteriia bacterium]|nr:M28 family peptidase [Coriobacteriia bacterium]
MTTPDGKRRQPRAAWVLPLVAVVSALAIVAAGTVGAFALSRPVVAPTRVSDAPLPRTACPSNLAALCAATREPTPTPDPALAFDAARALAHVRTLAAMGARAGGSIVESRAVGYVRAQLTAMGYESRIETVPLPGGKDTHNVVAMKQGSGPGVVVIGAHLDSKKPSPGANDNASGVGVMLELARVMKTRPASASIEFVAFGCEETMFAGSTEHHFGSRAHAAALRSARSDDRIAMFSVDMVGVGSTFAVRTMDKGPQGMRRELLAYAKKTKVKLTYVKDTAKTGSSDHEAFELAGEPAVWLQWREDPNYHTVRDTASRLVKAKVAAAGKLIAGFLDGVDDARIADWYVR